MAIAGQPDPRNLFLNAAFWPQGQAADVGTSVIVPQGNTQFDPFKGTSWGDWLDATGAGDPGGVKMAVRGLRSPDAAGQAGLDRSQALSGTGIGLEGGLSPAQNAAPGIVQGLAPGMLSGSAPGAIAGLQAAGPTKQAKQAMMKNQEQKAANFYPNATNFPYKPFGNY